MGDVRIRKLVESDYDQVIELYTQLDEFHVQARPDCFVHREKDKIYPKDAFLHNLAYPGSLDLGAFEGDRLIGFVSATLWEESNMRKDLKTVCLDDIFVLPPLPPQRNRSEALCGGGSLGQGAGCHPPGVAHLGFQQGCHRHVRSHGNDTPAVCI